METLLDVWEGSLDIDEALLQLEGVRGLVIRLNDMNGGHHMDQNFLNQWEQSKNFLRNPYCVYNPWVTGHQNATWFLSHIPQETTRIFLDVEVRKPDYGPDIYAAELQICVNELKVVHPTTIYTGGWFLSLVSPWPTNVDYWWARWPYTLCPQGDRQNWTWQQWRTTSEYYGYKPDPDHKCPSNIGLWQCSGDKLILPGCANRAIDLNLWSGNLPSLELYWGADIPEFGYQQKVDILWRETRLHHPDWNYTP